MLSKSGEKKLVNKAEERLGRAYELVQEMSKVVSKSSFAEFLTVLGANSDEAQAFNLYLEFGLRVLSKYKIAIPDEKIIELAETGEPLTQESCCMALGVLRSKAAAPILIHKIKNKKTEIRMAAVKALGSIGDDSAIPHLSKVVEGDADKKVKLKAAEAVTNIQRGRA
jgi:HEAT repeat protein